MITQIKPLFFVATIALIAITAYAQEEPAIGSARGYVNDFAGLLDVSSKAAIESLAFELEQKTTAQLAVVTVDTTQPAPIEDYAVRLFEQWGIGQRGVDNGVLLLVAVSDRKVRIETGYGLEGALPDAVCGKIIQQYIIPQFKAGKFNEGIKIGAAAILQLVAEEYDVELTGTEGQGIASLKPAPVHPLIAVARAVLYILFLFLLLGLRFGLFAFLLMGSGRRRGGYWYGSGYGGGSMGGFGGGFGGFGGGFSGGGGASGGW